METRHSRPSRVSSLIGAHTFFVGNNLKAPSDDSGRVPLLAGFARVASSACPTIFLGNGAPGGTRTPDLLVRSQTLYPAELRAHSRQILSQPRAALPPRHHRSSQDPRKNEQGQTANLACGQAGGERRVEGGWSRARHEQRLGPSML